MKTILLDVTSCNLKGQKQNEQGLELKGNNNGFLVLSLNTMNI